MEKQARFPYQFFVVTFVWYWLVWLPLVLAGAGSDLGLLALAAIFHPGNEPDVYAFCRVCVPDNGVFLVLRLGAPCFWKTHLGRVDFSRLGQCVCSPVPNGSDGCGGRTAPLLDMGKPDFCDWLDHNGHSVAKNKVSK